MRKGYTREMTMNFMSKITPPDVLDAPALWFIYHKGELLLHKDNATQPIPELLDIAELNMDILFQQYLGEWQQKHCFCLEIKSIENFSQQNLSQDYHWQPLRQAALNILSQELFHLAGRALQILQWDKNHQFCGHCGTPLSYSLVDRAKICERCNLSHYPRICPCMIVLIKRGKEILLARSPHFLPNVYSALAGFMEPGESVEEAVHREVNEEVGIKIKNLQYRFSQPWPFSDSLMLGFTAEHLAGEIEIDGVEIEDAGWFTLENLPALPSSISIAKKLIELFIQNQF